MLHAAEGKECSHREALDLIPGYDLELQDSFSIYLLKAVWKSQRVPKVGVGCSKNPTFES